MASYPSSIWSGNTRGTNLSDAEIHTTWHDEAMEEIIAIQTELGTAPSGSLSTVAARFNEFALAPTTWSSPLASGVTVGNGTTFAQYAQVGPIVHCYLSFTLGSTSAITGEVIVSLPVTSVEGQAVQGAGVFNDTGTAAYLAHVLSLTTSTARIKLVLASGTYAQPNTALSATVPFTWGNTDNISVSFSYLAP